MDKQILNFTVNEQILVCENPIKISTNKVNYIQASFDLGENWSGFDSVRAVWFNDFNCISTVLDSLGNCAVPFEVMKRKGNVKVNLVGSISEDDVLTDRLTSYPVVAVIVDCTAQITGAETSPITPSQFEQYVAIVQALVGSVRDIDRIELNDDYTLTIYYSDGTSDTTSSIRGATGNGIASIAKTGSSGSNPVVDTYTVTYTDGNTFTFTITNGIKGDTGNGISKIEKTGSSGTNPVIDTYRITYTNGQTTTFTVTNGVKGDTGNGIASIYKTGESGAVKTYTILMTDGSTFDFDVTDGEVTQAVLDATVEEIQSDIYQSTIVQVKSDTEPYHFRQTNAGQGCGHKEYDEIVGASVGWNQLVQNGNFSDGTTGWNKNNGDISASNNKLTFTTTYKSTYQYVSHSCANPKDHVALYMLDVTLSEAEKFGLGDGNAIMKTWNLSANTKTHIAYMTKHSGDRSMVYLYPARTAGLNIDATAVFENVQVFDLTLALGSTIADYAYTLEQSTAGSGVTWLKSHFPKLFDNGYQPFDSGSIQSVSGLVSHDMVGFNAFDDEVENGGYSTAGKIWGDPNLRNKNLIKVIEGQTYYFRIPNIQSLYVFGYSDENYSDGVNLGSTNFETTIPQGVHYIGFFFGKSQYGNVYNHDICINLSDTSINGQYFPYEKHTYPLDSSVELRGKYKLDANNNLYADGDVYKSSGEGTENYYEVDLGTLEWSARNEYWRTAVYSDAKAGTNNVIADVVCAKYVSATPNGFTSANKSITIATDGRINIYDTAFDGMTGTQVATALGGVKLVYKKSTPTTFSADPYTNPQTCDPNGTEEYVSTSIVPIGHNTDYPMTLVDTMPSANGTYEPRVTISNGVKTITWVSV